MGVDAAFLDLAKTLGAHAGSLRKLGDGQARVLSQTAQVFGQKHPGGNKLEGLHESPDQKRIAKSLRSVFWLATCSERLWNGFMFVWLGKECRDRHAKRHGQLLDDADGRVFEFPLKAAHEGAVHPGIERKTVLCQAALNAQAAHVPGK